MAVFQPACEKCGFRGCRNRCTKHLTSAGTGTPATSCPNSSHTSRADISDPDFSCKLHRVIPGFAAGVSRPGKGPGHPPPQRPTLKGPPPDMSPLIGTDLA